MLGEITMPSDRPLNSFNRAAPARARKPTNISIAPALVAEARELGVNLSQAAEVGIAEAVARRRQERWLEENREALESSNAFVEEHGLPLERHRVF
ncbi:MAG TPA: type II toxin-antitoxin system CcdA family antitoxin [Burkholderiaceae bacterium]|nr:type II toxin-antitoxin system CcdA family antitoxin [Burkholderiaceae bacterium]